MSEEPIKFRCYRCGKLLGASTRRVGAVVSCPQCRAEIQVPEPDAGAETAVKPEPAPVGDAVGAVLEIDEAFLAPDAPVDPVIPAIRYETPTIRDVPPPSAPRAPDVILPPAVVLAWSLLVLAAIPLAFIAGLLIGRFLWK